MKKAFTLIELLVVIVIMGIILVIAIPSVMKLMTSNSRQAYDIHMKTVESATSLYAVKNKGVLDIDVVGECYKLSYDELKKSQDIKEEEITCDGDIYIFKTNKDYDYQYNLTCTDKKGREYSKKEENNISCTVFDDSFIAESNLLESLTITDEFGNSYSLSPEFDPNIFQYTVKTEAEKVNIEAKAASSNAEVSGIGSRILLVGNNNQNIVVKIPNSKKKTYTINIENTQPTQPTFALVGANNITSFSTKVSLTNASTSLLGIKNYQYYVSTNRSSQIGGGWKDLIIDENNIGTIKFSNEGKNYVFFRAIGKGGMKSLISSDSLIYNITNPITIKINPAGNMYEGDGAIIYFDVYSKKSLRSINYKVYNDDKVYDNGNISYSEEEKVGVISINAYFESGYTININACDYGGDCTNYTYTYMYGSDSVTIKKSSQIINNDVYIIEFEASSSSSDIVHMYYKSFKSDGSSFSSEYTTGSDSIVAKMPFTGYVVVEACDNDGNCNQYIYGK